MAVPYIMRPVIPPERGATRWPDEAGLRARFGAELPPGTVVRRNPGEESSCEDCMASPDGYCKAHPEFWIVKAPAPEPQLERGNEDEPAHEEQEVVP